MTWMDLFFICANKALEDKVGITVRYPIDTYQNQLYTMVRVSSTIKTESVVINDILYKWYPKIDQSQIGRDTSNMFIDTYQMCNLYCSAMDADFDGDQITFKIAFTVEANDELRKYINSNSQLINLTGVNNRTVSKECLQALYNMTLVLPESKLTDPTF